MSNDQQPDKTRLKFGKLHLDAIGVLATAIAAIAMVSIVAIVVMGR